MKYILEYSKFSNNSLDPQLTKFIDNNFNFKLNRPNSKLKEFARFRLNGYKKFVTSLRKGGLKESASSDNVNLLDKIIEMDEEMDDFIGILAEFRATILKNDKYEKMSADNLIAYLNYTLNKVGMKNVIFDSDPNVTNAAGRFKGGNIYIYFHNIVSDITFKEFIYSDDKDFYGYLFNISITFYHEFVHALQHHFKENQYILNSLKNFFYTGTLVALNLKDATNAYLSDPLEIEAFAHETVKRLSIEYTFDEIKRMIGGIDFNSANNTIAAYVKNALLNKNFKTLNIFLKSMNDVLDKRVELGVLGQ